MQYNAYPDEEDFFSLDRFFAQFYRADVFGPEEEISIHGETTFPTDQPSAGEPPLNEVEVVRVGRSISHSPAGAARYVGSPTRRVRPDEEASR